MNPQYLNQGQGYGPGPGGMPPQGYGGPPPGQQMNRQQMQSNPMYNGSGPAQRPPGPPGAYGPPPMKGGMPPMQNGPRMPPAGPQGDQGMPRGFPPSSQPGQFPPGQMRGPPTQGQMPGPNQNHEQVTNQMGSMNINNGPPRPGMQQGMPGPPRSSGQMPPPQQFGQRPPGPPTSMYGQTPTSMSGPGPVNTMGPPPTSMGPPSSLAGPPSMGGPPSSMAGPPSMGGPPSSMAGPPPSMTGPPSSMSGPQTSMGGPPPSSMAGPPMSSQPSYYGGAPPPMSSAAQPGMPPMPGPPSGPMGPPPPSMGGVANAPAPLPPQKMDPSAQTYGMQQPGPMPSPGAGGSFNSYPDQGYQSQSRGPPAGPGPGQQQQPRRLDPDHMPSPIQVMEEDKRNRGGVFQTGARGTVPPLVTTNFTVEDQGNCNPRMVRSTMYNVPCTSDMLKQSHIPFVLNYTPFAKLAPKELAPPVVDLGKLGPVRCNRCKAYMCPYMQFVDGGRRFQCCFCNCTTEVPPEYFSHLDHTGRRLDAFDRPELCLGAYEFVATEDYCKNNKLPNPPAFIFMIDVSYNSIKSGLVYYICEHLKNEVLVNLPKDENMEESEIRVGFVTYTKELHFYNVKGALAQPQMLVVSDVQDVFVPLLDGFLVKLSESEAVIDSLLEQIPAMFAEARETEIVLGPVIQAGLDALKSAECVGKLFIFHSSLPIAEAPGKLKNRDDRKLLGTDKEKTILSPQNNFYTKLGQECVAAGCGVDIFLFPNAYVDIATISEVPRLTGGDVYKYMYFQADIDGPRFISDLKKNVERPIAFDAIMRVRTSTGIRPVDFLGNFYMSNTTDVELAAVDCDKSITVEIKHDDKLSESEGAYTQAAVLYTSHTGQRRLRILNLALNCCNQMADLFRNCELDVLVNHMAKFGIRSSLNSNPKTVREHLMNQCAQILACYRKNCASPSSAGQLILPECMKLLPVYTNCIIKSDALQGAGVTTDDRSYLMHIVNSMTVKDSCKFFYPTLMPLHDMNLEAEDLPTPIRCSYERLKDNGVYLLENGLLMFMWIGIQVNPQWVQNVFGVQSVNIIDIDKTHLQDLDNPTSRRVRDVVRKVREGRPRHMKLVIVRQRDKLEPVFMQYLMEDRGNNGSASYVDFLCHIHKEIRNLLN